MHCKMGDLSDSESGQTVGCEFSWSVCNYNGRLMMGVSSAAVVEVMAACTDHGETSPAEGNSGRKPKLSERDRCTLKRIVSEKS